MPFFPRKLTVRNSLFVCVLSRASAAVWCLSLSVCWQSEGKVFWATACGGFSAHHCLSRAEWLCRIVRAWAQALTIVKNLAALSRDCRKQVSLLRHYCSAARWDWSSTSAPQLLAEQFPTVNVPHGGSSLFQCHLHPSTGITAAALCSISIAGDCRGVVPTLTRVTGGLAVLVNKVWASCPWEGTRVLCRFWYMCETIALLQLLMLSVMNDLLLILPSKLIYYYTFSWAVHQSVLMMKGMLHTHLITAHIFV